MHFRTQIPIKTSANPIGYQSRVLSLGSCFAVNIAEKLDYFKFENCVNPFGILFHPLALEKFVNFAVSHKAFTTEDVFFHNERWHCFDAHSDFSRPNKEQLLDNLNTLTKSANRQIIESTHVIITLGTAWVYTDVLSGNVVANCHKIAQSQFTKRLLSASEIGASLSEIISLFKTSNPNIKIIFTISPVRHIKDGFVENQWSKSNLISALQQVLSTDDTATYFPSYEIVLDELRDYRFYAEDMLHPNQTAIDYIWERFSESYISADSRATLQEVEQIQKSLSHRAFNPESQQHREFLAKLNDRIAALQKIHPQINF